MGLFSWMAQDTKRSIPCAGAPRPTFEVTMTDNKGNRWHENDYEGYGEFAGKDYYELLAEMNGFESDRNIGISIYFNPGKYRYPKFPNITEDSEWVWRNSRPDDCEHQGYFYPEVEDEHFNY